MFRFTILVIFFLYGCSSGSNQSDDSTIDISKLIGTTWQSTNCEIVFGGYLSHTIEFSETSMTFQYFQCDTQSIVLTEVRPFSIGNTVTTESGLKATKITLTRNSLPLIDNDFVYTYQQIDYIYYANDSFYLAGKDYVSNCKTLEEVESPPTVGTLACTEWKAILDYDQIYTKKI